ncbi:hypothetical protein Tco_1144181 [Tanacetum coccineum]
MYSSFQDQERYEHDGPLDTRPQDDEKSQDDDQRLDLAGDLKKAQDHISSVNLESGEAVVFGEDEDEEEEEPPSPFLPDPYWEVAIWMQHHSKILAAESGRFECRSAELHGYIGDMDKAVAILLT